MSDVLLYQIPSEREYFCSPDCSEFVVDFHSKKGSQNVQNLGFFQKKMIFSFKNRERLQYWCRMRIKWYFFLEVSSPPFLSGFGGKKSAKFGSFKI